MLRIITCWLKVYISQTHFILREETTIENTE